MNTVAASFDTTVRQTEMSQRKTEQNLNI